MSCEMAPPSKKPNNVSMELVLHNSDLVREILQWLPAKSLVNFRSICREWRLLISFTAFKQQHTLRHPKLQQHSLILQTAALPRRWFHLNPNSHRLTSLSTLSRLPPNSDIIIVQSSNGLLLLQPKKWLRNQYFYVHNPATGQSRKIYPPCSTTHPDVFDVVLAFNPSKSPYYELFCFRGSSCANPRAEVYSSKSHSWKELTLDPFENITYIRISFISLLRQRVRVYWNNAIYWSSKREPNYQCFDIATRVMEFLYGPATDHGDREKNAYWCLQESNGHLYHVELMK